MLTEEELHSTCLCRMLWQSSRQDSWEEEEEAEPKRAQQQKQISCAFEEWIDGFDLQGSIEDRRGAFA